jgi:hypothetical protein
VKRNAGDYREEEKPKMLTFEQERQAIKDAIARFPKYFNIRGTSGTFRISESSSFFSGSTLYLYTEIEHEGKWESYAKGTESELRNVLSNAWTPTKQYDPLLDANQAIGRRDWFVECEDRD